MRGRPQSVGWPIVQCAICVLLCLLAGCGCVLASGVVDRIVVIVNRHAILQSEWEESVRFEALMNGRPLKEITPEERKQALERLIDQELIEEQKLASNYVPATAAEVAARIHELRESVPGWRTDAGWNAALASYGLSGQDVMERTQVQLNLLRYIDLRFRPEIHVDHKAVENYYVEQLVPELHRSGAALVPLQQAAPKIEQLLVEQRLTDIQNHWVSVLRSQARIEMR